MARGDGVVRLNERGSGDMQGGSMTTGGCMHAPSSIHPTKQVVQMLLESTERTSSVVEL